MFDRQNMGEIMRKVYKVTGTGNSVADYTEVHETCPDCEGSGTKTGRVYKGNGTFEKVEIECPTCQGNKTISRKF